MLKVVGYLWETVTKSTIYKGYDVEYVETVSRTEASYFIAPSDVIAITPTPYVENPHESEGREFYKDCFTVHMRCGNTFSIKGDMADMASVAGGENRFIMLPVTFILYAKVTEFYELCEVAKEIPLTVSHAFGYFDAYAINSIMPKMDHGPFGDGNRHPIPGRCLVSFDCIPDHFVIEMDPKDVHDKLMKFHNA